MWSLNVNDKNATFTIEGGSSQVNLVHLLNKVPSVSVIDTAGYEVNAYDNTMYDSDKLYVETSITNNSVSLNFYINGVLNGNTNELYVILN